MIATILFTSCTNNMNNKIIDITEKPISSSLSVQIPFIEVKVGDTLQYMYFKHSSVGNEVDFIISDEKCIELSDNKIEYKYPEKMKPGWTGGDASNGVFIFKAISKGQCLLTLQNLFRGELEEEKKIKIIVK